jgi:hypothetical protein
MEKILNRYLVIQKDKLNNFSDDLCDLADFYVIAGEILEKNNFPLKLYLRYKKFIKNGRKK